MARLSKRSNVPRAPVRRLADCMAGLPSLVSIHKRMFFSGVEGTKWSWDRERVVVFRV